MGQHPTPLALLAAWRFLTVPCPIADWFYPIADLALRRSKSVIHRAYKLSAFRALAQTESRGEDLPSRIMTQSVLAHRSVAVIRKLNVFYWELSKLLTVVIV